MRLTILLAVVLFISIFALAGQAHAAALININTADATTLDTLPGIGSTKAAAVVDYRSANGAFVVIEDIEKVKGIGPVTFSNIKSLITVEGGVSTTQPVAPKTSYQKVQTVGPAFSTSVSPSAHGAQMVTAPATSSSLAAAGAALPAASGGVLSVLTASPLALGILGVLVFSGMALMVL